MALNGDASPELVNFGSLIRYAMLLEETTVEAYDKLAMLENEKIVETVKKLQRTHTSRLQTLSRVRRENLSEMLLEPISGLSSKSYLVSDEFATKLEQANNILDLIMALTELTKKAGTFYQDSIDKGKNALAEVSNTFRRFVKENRNNEDILATILEKLRDKEFA